MTTTNQLDPRELITKHYELMSDEELEQLKASIMHDIIQRENGRQLLHREYTQIRIVLASRRLHEPLVVPVGEGE